MRYIMSGAAATLLADFDGATASFERGRAIAATGARAVTLQDLATRRAENADWQGRIPEARGFIEEAIAQAALVPFESYLTVITYGAGLHVEADAAVAARMSDDRAAEVAAVESAKRYASTAARIGRETGVLQGLSGPGRSHTPSLRARGDSCGRRAGRCGLALCRGRPEHTWHRLPARIRAPALGGGACTVGVPRGPTSRAPSATASKSRRVPMSPSGVSC